MVFFCKVTKFPRFSIANSYDFQCKIPKISYKEVIKTAIGGAAGVIHAVDSAVANCQSNENVEVLRVFMLDKRIECRPVWKPMHK